MMNNDEIDHKKVLNSKCGCGIGLPWKKDNVVMAYPCEHMYHEKCFDRIIECTLCGERIEKKISMYDEDIHYQRFADIFSMSYYDNMSQNTPSKFIDSIFDVASIFAHVPMITTREDVKKLCEDVFSLNNLTISVYGLEKIKQEKNKVYICNHVSHLELFVLYYLFENGFLVSSIANSEHLMDRCKKVIPILMVNRGDKNRGDNIIEEMRKFVEKHGSICLFPEGLMKHPDALVRFRTGAFHIGYPVYAITIRHNDIVSDGYINGFLYKLSAKRNINMEVHVLGPYYPPFDEKSIEKIRIEMAKNGNMVLSRVANRDIIDKKN